MIILTILLKYSCSRNLKRWLQKKTFLFNIKPCMRYSNEPYDTIDLCKYNILKTDIVFPCTNFLSLYGTDIELSIDQSLTIIHFLINKKNCLGQSTQWMSDNKMSAYLNCKTPLQRERKEKNENSTVNSIFFFSRWKDVLELRGTSALKIM